MKRMDFTVELERLRMRRKLAFGEAFGLLKSWINQIKKFRVALRHGWYSYLADSSAFEKRGNRILIQPKEH